MDSGEASDKILEMAEKRDVTPIVMGKVGRHTVKELLIGSTANSGYRRSRDKLSTFITAASGLVAALV